MGQTFKNKITYDLNDDIANFFSLPIEEPNEEINYKLLKKQIYNLDIDSEEKANIINKINSLSTNKNEVLKDKIKKEIQEIKIKYNL